MSGLGPEELRRLLDDAAPEVTASPDALGSILSRGHRRRRRRHALVGGAATAVVVVAAVLGTTLLRQAPAPVPPATSTPTVISTTPQRLPNAFVAADGTGVVRVFDLASWQPTGEPLKLSSVLATDDGAAYSADSSGVRKAPDGSAVASASPNSKIVELTVRGDHLAFIEDSDAIQRLVVQSGKQRDSVLLPAKAFSYGPTVAPDGTVAYLSNLAQGVYQLSIVRAGKPASAVKLPTGCSYTGLAWMGAQLETVQSGCGTTKILLIEPGSGRVTSATDAPDIGPFTMLTINSAEGVTMMSYRDKSESGWHYRVEVNGQVRTVSPRCADKTACPGGPAYLLTR